MTISAQFPKPVWYVLSLLVPNIYLVSVRLPSQGPHNLYFPLPTPGFVIFEQVL